MERYGVSLIKTMNYEPSILTDQLKLEISIEIASALVGFHSGKFELYQNEITPMNILLNLEEIEPGYIILKKLAFADFGISSKMNKLA